MPRNKSITSIDNRIKKVQEDLFFKRYLKVANPSMMC